MTTCPILEAIHRAGIGLTAARAVVSLTAGSTSTGELATRLNLSRAGGTGLVDALEKAGLIETYQELIDRRKRHARLTHAGLNLARQIIGAK